MSDPPVTDPRGTVEFIEDVRLRSKTLSYALRLITLSLHGRPIHYYYLNGASVAVFYLPDICELIKDLTNKKDLLPEKVAKSLDISQIEHVQSPIILSNGTSPAPQGKGFWFVTVDAFIKLIALHCQADIQRECLILLLKFVEGMTVTTPNQ